MKALLALEDGKVSYSTTIFSNKYLFISLFNDL